MSEREFFSRESIRSNVSILSNLSILLLAAATVHAGTGSGQSAAFRVDTRATTAVRVTGVTSRWCEGMYGGAGRHVYFLAGVGLDVAFTAQVDWGGKTGSRLEFNGADNGLNYAKSLNVGSLGTGGKLEVVAVATDGTRSPAFRANFDVAPLPPFANMLFYPQVLSQGNDLIYTTPEFDMDIFKGKSGVVQGCPIPGDAMEVQPKFRAEGEFKGDGTLTIKAAVGENQNIKVNKTQKHKPDGKWGEAAGVEFGLDVEGEVVAFWNQTTGGWSVNTAMLGFNVYGQYSTPPYYIYAPPPIYLRADISADLSISLRIRDLGTGQGWTPDFVLQSEALPKVKGVLGCGASGVLALEGYVSLGGIIDAQSPPLVINKFGVGGEVGAEIILLCFTVPIDIWSGQIWIINLDEGINPFAAMSSDHLFLNAKPLNLAALDTRAFQPLGRDYLKRGGTKRLAIASTLRVLSLTGGSETVLMADGYPYPDPAVAAAGVTNHVLYVRDNPGRLAENRTELVNVFNGGAGWSAPVAVWDDGTGDFAPQTAALADGTLLAVWANGRAALTNGATLDEALAGLEIAAGERDPATGAWTCRNLTDNAWLDHSPMLAAAADGSAMAAWIRNRYQNPTGTPAEPNRILFARRSDGVWSDEDYVAVNLGTITYCDLAYNGSEAALVFAMDLDGDLETREDQELYGCAFNGSQWGPYVRLTTDSLQDTRPYVRYAGDGSLLVVWFQDGKILSARGLGLENPVVAGEVGIASGAQDFKLVTGPDGQLAAVWQDAGVAGEVAPDPYILNYDPAQGVWSHGVRLLEDPALERGFAGLFGADGRLLLAYSKVAVGEDAEGVPVFGAVDLCVLDHPVGPDPAIGQYGISLSTNEVEVGESVDILVTVENRGDLTVTNLAVCVYEGAVQVGATQRVAQLLGGASVVVSVPWTVPEAASNTVLRAVVDPGLETDDRNRANNTATLAALLPDLSVDSASAFNESTNQRLIKATVMNAGAVPTPEGVQVTFRRGASDGELLATDTLGELVFGTNGVYDAGFQWAMGGTVFTSAFEVVYIAVDPTNSVDEIDERNNTTAVQVMTSLDSDGDGLLDGEELRLGTRVDLTDSDGDGLSDFDEIRVHGTNPLLRDSDGDGVSDSNEIRAGTDPNSETDVFKIVAADGSEAVVMRVRWNAKAGKTYQVECASALAGPWGDAPNGAGEDGDSLRTAVVDGVQTYTDGTDPAPAARFYRVRIVEP
ncbi:MAG: hypothetical protein FJ222_10150 [Lentisphaerae bacterium]|nr:hypothetical protein [Lentisphaerota bacterium]